MVYCWADVSIVTSSVDCCAVAMVLLLVLVVCLMRDEFLANPLATFSSLTILEFFKTEPWAKLICKHSRHMSDLSKVCSETAFMKIM